MLVDKPNGTPVSPNTPKIMTAGFAWQNNGEKLIKHTLC